MAAIAYRTAICSHPKPWGALLPRSDPLYGLEPDTTEDYGANLSAMATRGERGTLIVSIDSLASMSSNPFRLCRAAHRSRHLVTSKARAMMRQRRPLGIGAAGALLLSGCDIWLRAGPFRPCETLLSAAVCDDLPVHVALQGMDATQVLDTHCQVFGAIPQLNPKRPNPPQWRHLGGAWLPSSMPLGPRQMAWPMDLKEPKYATRLATAREPR